jgi:7,8-dihydropterin-6-yl-methyl-4-(beta-D-ribofuranosyl)aminobenzene 5'-phosphate synthase
MKLIVLVDNHTLIDRYFQGEPGVAYFIECNGKNYLFDTGYSDLFLKNAVKMNVNLLQLEAVVLSHGHNDHTWGLGELVKFYSEAAGHSVEHPALVAHPDAFLDKKDQGLDIGSMLSLSQLKKSFVVQLSKNPLWLNDKLVFLGEIPRNNLFEATVPIGKTLRADKWEDDFVLDDSALVYKSAKGLVIISGCSHAGICNIIEYAKKVCSEERVYDIIGGFHLLAPEPGKINNTVNYFSQVQPHAVYACHCTDLSSKIKLAQVVNMGEVGVGLVLEY